LFSVYELDIKSVWHWSNMSNFYLF